MIYKISTHKFKIKKNNNFKIILSIENALPAVILKYSEILSCLQSHTYTINAHKWQIRTTEPIIFRKRSFKILSAIF